MHRQVDHAILTLTGNPCDGSWHHHVGQQLVVVCGGLKGGGQLHEAAPVCELAMMIGAKAGNMPLPSSRQSTINLTATALKNGTHDPN